MSGPWGPGARRAATLSGLLLLGLGGWLPLATRAGVLQEVAVRLEAGGVQVERDQAETFAALSSGIVTDIQAGIGAFPALRYGAVAAAGRFGSVGLRATTARLGDELHARAFIASDEFANLTGVSQRATARFVIDGGELHVDSGLDTLAGYRMRVEGWNLGRVEATGNLLDLNHIHGRIPGWPFGGAIFDTEGMLRADATGHLRFHTAGRDIGAAFDAARQRVEVPLSLQSLDLGVLAPGDRLYLRYTLDLRAGGPGIAELVDARFSDPLALSGTPSIGRIELAAAPPIPEPPAWLLLLLGAAALAAVRRGGRCVGGVATRGR